MDAYKEDLAFIHDVGFTKFIKSNAPAILKILNQNGIKKGHVVDIGCGSGTWANILADKGYTVSGVDISPNMIKIAKQNVPKANFTIGSFIDYQIPPCHVVTAFGEIFNYLFDKKNNLKRLTRFFERVYQSLQPNGLFIFDIAEPGRGGDLNQKFFDCDDWTILVAVEENKKTNRLIRNIISYRKMNDQYRRSDEKHILQLYKSTEIAKILRKIGFKVHIDKEFGNLRLPKGWVTIIAKKNKPKLS